MIDIIIPTMYRDGCLLRSCLTSIKRYTRSTPDCKIRVTVIANDPDLNLDSEEFADKSTFVLRLGQEIFEDSDIEFDKFNSHPGYANAINMGIQYCSGRCKEYYILLNDDRILQDQEPNAWLTKLLAQFEVDEKCGIMGVRKMQECGYNFTPFFCVAIRKEMVEKIGLLDNRFDTGSMEDVDYCIRAQREGWRVGYVDEELAGHFPLWHVGGNTVTKIRNWDYIYHLNQLKLKDKYKRENIVHVVVPCHKSDATIEPVLDAIILQQIFMFGFMMMAV